MKLDVIVEVGSKRHTASVYLTARCEGSSSYSGTIVSDEFGSGSIRCTRNGDELRGDAMLDNHTADFYARLSGNQVTGYLKHGWFLRFPFDGTITE